MVELTAARTAIISGQCEQWDDSEVQHAGAAVQPEAFGIKPHEVRHAEGEFPNGGHRACKRGPRVQTDEGAAGASVHAQVLCGVPLYGDSQALPHILAAAIPAGAVLQSVSRCTSSSASAPTRWGAKALLPTYGMCGECGDESRRERSSAWTRTSCACACHPVGTARRLVRNRLVKAFAVRRGVSSWALSAVHAVQAQ